MNIDLMWQIISGILCLGLISLLIAVWKASGLPRSAIEWVPCIMVNTLMLVFIVFTGAFAVLGIN